MSHNLKPHMMKYVSLGEIYQFVHRVKKFGQTLELGNELRGIYVIIHMLNFLTAFVRIA